MTAMSDLSRDSVEEILSRVPVTSLRAVRSTCKGWNGLSKCQSFTKKHCGKAAKEFLVIMTYEYKVCLMSVNLRGIYNREDLVNPSIEVIGKLLNQVEIRQVFHSGGLLLCVSGTKYMWSLVVWNPYSGQVRVIKPRTARRLCDSIALGYDNNNNNHKIFRRSMNSEYEIYDFKSNLWKSLVVTADWEINFGRPDVSLKGNTYYVAQEIWRVERVETDYYFLLCFDFATETFGPRLHLPFHTCYNDSVALSSVREEQLAVLLTRGGTCVVEVWITNKIEPNAVSWMKFLVVNDERIWNLIRNFIRYGSCFFIDEEKKVVVVPVRDNAKRTKNIAYMFRENGYYGEVNLGDSESWPQMWSYVPSSVKIQ